MVRTAERTVVTTLLDFRFAFMVEYLNVARRGRDLSRPARDGFVNALTEEVHFQGLMALWHRRGRVERQRDSRVDGRRAIRVELTRGQASCIRTNT